MQSSQSLREIQPETGAVSMDKCYLSIALLLCQSSSNSLVRASDWNSEDPGSNPGCISMSFFRHHSTLQIKTPFNNSIMVAKRGGGRVSAWDTLQMLAALAGCKMALVFSDCTCVINPWHHVNQMYLTLSRESLGTRLCKYISLLHYVVVLCRNRRVFRCILSLPDWICSAILLNLR